MVKETKIYGRHNNEPVRQKRPPYQSLERIKSHLTSAAEAAEEAGVFLKAAEIKRINADICHTQGKERDAYLLECSISALTGKASD